ncbi:MULTISPECIES: DNA cytosine methyltransferase [Brevundimonas]|uniref:DNA cytosine methyltransferase n=1 Tax=Brevundimonas sp. UBA7507 TaxID=1946137 RepID=UPI00257F4820|nr:MULTISPECIES: DNA (cytosine-5-)-methyltransferase [Brevundimonas]
MKVLDLFSGIGGFSMGLERAGMETVAFCEIDPFCRRVLAKHWPEVPCYDDVQTLTASRLVSDGVGRVDVITGGFPCQDISLAGRMRGIDGKKSSMWEELARLVEEARPKFVILENSPVLRSRGLDRILSKFASLGYDAEWHCLPLNAIGAPHRRDRVWVIAYPAGLGDRLPEGQVCTGRNLAQHGTWWGSEPNVCRVDDGFPNGAHRRRVLGNAVCPTIPEILGRAIIAAANPVREEIAA